MWSDSILKPLLQGQMRVAKLKIAHNLLIIGPRVLGCETDIYEIMGCESSDGSDLTLDPSFKVK